MFPNVSNLKYRDNLFMKMYRQIFLFLLIFLFGSFCGAQNHTINTFRLTSGFVAVSAPNTFTLENKILKDKNGSNISASRMPMVRENASKSFDEIFKSMALSSRPGFVSMQELSSNSRLIYSNPTSQNFSFTLVHQVNPGDIGILDATGMLSKESQLKDQFLDILKSAKWTPLDEIDLFEGLPFFIKNHKNYGCFRFLDVVNCISSLDEKLIHRPWILFTTVDSKSNSLDLLNTQFDSWAGMRDIVRESLDGLTPNGIDSALYGHAYSLRFKSKVHLYAAIKKVGDLKVMILCAQPYDQKFQVNNFLKLIDGLGVK
jgi:hypothetical protein